MATRTPRRRRRTADLAFDASDYFSDDFTIFNDGTGKYCFLQCPFIVDFDQTNLIFALKDCSNFLIFAFHT